MDATYWTLLRNGRWWLCSDVGIDYVFDYGEMVGMWKRYGPNAMRYY